MAPRRYLLAAPALLFLFLTALAAPDDDPFSGANAVSAAKPAQIAPAQEKVVAQPAGKRPPTADRIDFTVSVEPAKVRRGALVKVTIAGTPRKGFHTYPLTQRTPNQAASYLSRISFSAVPGLQPLWPIQESTPEFIDSKVEGIFLEHEKPFTWVQEVLVSPDAQPGPRELRLQIKLQVCDDKTCVPGTHELEAKIEVTAAPPLELTPALKERLQARPENKVVPAPATLPKSEAPGKGPARADSIPATPAKVDTSLLGVILSSMAAAILMVFTPCVFPMIPITVSFFVKQSEKEHHRPLVTAGVYSLTIIVVLALAVVLLGGLIVKLANNAWMNLALGGVLIYFALSLFGMYDIELPSGLARFTSAREGQGGQAGAFFMALTFTITSFTCTGPFLGPLLATAATMQLSFVELLLAAVAYSTAFAAPFFLLALFPTLLKSLPKSGGWLNSVKVVMGFLELAAALKFLGNTDATLNPGNPWLFTYDTVLCSWIALSVACGLYLLGLFRLPHDDPAEHIGVIRMVLATTFFGMALHLMPALWRETPLSVVGESLVAFLPRDTRPPRSTAGDSSAEAQLPWHLDYETAWKEAVRDHKLIFIDFTGVNCTNCRDNENRVFPKPAVRAELAKYVRVQLYNDSVPKRGLGPAQAEAEADQNREWQGNTVGDVSTPLYVILKPDKDLPVEGGKLKGIVLGKRGGKIFDTEIDDFVAMLRKPLNGQAAQGKVQRKGANSSLAAFRVARPQ